MSSHGYGGVSGKGKARYDVGRWWQRAPKAPHTPFASRLRGQVMTCPSCRGATPLAPATEVVYACAACGGSFVEDAGLEHIVSEMIGAPWQMPPLVGDVGERPCPVCPAVMIREPVEGVMIDRCREHGTWFDSQELQAMLEKVGEPPPAPTSWLRRLLSRGDREDALPTARVIKDES